jgi:hypothetical protein
MLKPRTHFEQVPLKIVRKIVEEQIRLQTTTEQNQETKKKAPEEDLWGAHHQSITARSRTFSRVEL